MYSGYAVTIACRIGLISSYCCLTCCRSQHRESATQIQLSGSLRLQVFAEVAAKQHMARLCVATKGFGGSLCLCNTWSKGSQTSSLSSSMSDKAGGMHVAPCHPSMHGAAMTRITPVKCALHPRFKGAFIRQSRVALTPCTCHTGKVWQEGEARLVLVHPAVCSGHVQDTRHMRQRLIPCDWCRFLHMQGCLPVSAITCLTC